MQTSQVVLIISLCINLIAVITPVFIWVKSREKKFKILELLLLRQAEGEDYKLMFRFLNLHKDIIRLSGVNIVLKNLPYDTYEDAIDFSGLLPKNLERGDDFSVTINLNKLHKIKKQIPKYMDICFHDSITDKTYRKRMKRGKIKNIFKWYSLK